MAEGLTPSRLRRRWAAADAQQRRALIIDVALDLLHRHGLAQVTVRRVAQRLGVGAMTLYTYVQGRDELRRQMTRRGFEQLHAGCRNHAEATGRTSWRPGARSYLQFAIDHPNLYHLMFSTPTAGDEADDQILLGGLRPLLERVRERLAQRGLTGKRLNQEAPAAAGRFWIALHGLASLAIANRTSVLKRSLDDLLDDLLPRVQPDDGA